MEAAGEGQQGAPGGSSGRTHLAGVIQFHFAVRRITRVQLPVTAVR